MAKHMPIIIGVLLLLTWFCFLFNLAARAEDMEILFEGIDPSQRDYVIQYRAPGESLITEDHFQLFPPAQWHNPRIPLHAQDPYSTMKDWDGDGQPSEKWSRYSNTRYIWDWDFHVWGPKR